MVVERQEGMEIEGTLGGEFIRFRDHGDLGENDDSVHRISSSRETRLESFEIMVNEIRCRPRTCLSSSSLSQAVIPPPRCLPRMKGICSCATSDELIMASPRMLSFSNV